MRPHPRKLLGIEIGFQTWQALPQLERLLMVGLVAVWSTGCWYSFERETAQTTGAVTGTAVLSSTGQPASFAKIEPMGAGFTKTADVTGAFRVEGLSPGGWVFSIQHDHDGDGWPEQAAVTNAFLTLQEEADGLIGAGGVTRGSWLLGQVVLEGTGMLLGTVTLNGQPAAGARVVIFRESAIPLGLTDDLSGYSSVELMESMAESFHSTDSQGRYFIPGVIPGKIMLAAMVQPAGEGTSYTVSRPVEITVDPAQTLEATEVPVINIDGQEGERRDVRVSLPEWEELGDTVQVAWSAPGTTRERALGNGTVEVSSSVTFSCPVGVWDVHVSSGDYVGVYLNRVVVRPRDGDDRGGILNWGPAMMHEELPCGHQDEDCDNDGIKRLPVSGSEPDWQIWRACGDICRHAFGTAKAGAVCLFEGTTYDCDDDGDGQPDVTEPFDCIGPGQGNDWDGDGLCSVADPYPMCADPAGACEACGDHAFTIEGCRDYMAEHAQPKLLSEYRADTQIPDAGAPDAGGPDAGGPDAGGPDAGAPDAGAPDAGAPDAGAPDAGGPDAGGPDAGAPDAGTPSCDAQYLETGPGECTLGFTDGCAPGQIACTDDGAGGGSCACVFTGEYIYNSATGEDKPYSYVFEENLSCTNIESSHPAWMLDACAEKEPVVCFGDAGCADPLVCTQPITGQAFCADDTDGDGVPDLEDNCVADMNLNQADQDLDVIGDACDNCPGVPNPNQTNTDLDLQNGDDLGDACDPDIDGDEILNDGNGGGSFYDAPCLDDEDVDCDDNCPYVANADQHNIDDDALGSACDKCPWVYEDFGQGVTAPVQPDSDADGFGDACDFSPGPNMTANRAGHVSVYAEMSSNSHIITIGGFSAQGAVHQSTERLKLPLFLFEDTQDEEKPSTFRDDPDAAMVAPRWGMRPWGHGVISVDPFLGNLAVPTELLFPNPLGGVLDPDGWFALAGGSESSSISFEPWLVEPTNRLEFVHWIELSGAEYSWTFDVKELSVNSSILTLPARLYQASEAIANVTPEANGDSEELLLMGGVTTNGAPFGSIVILGVEDQLGVNVVRVGQWEFDQGLGPASVTIDPPRFGQQVVPVLDQSAISVPVMVGGFTDANYASLADVLFMEVMLPPTGEELAWYLPENTPPENSGVGPSWQLETARGFHTATSVTDVEPWGEGTGGGTQENPQVIVIAGGVDTDQTTLSSVEVKCTKNCELANPVDSNPETRLLHVGRKLHVATVVRNSSFEKCVVFTGGIDENGDLVDAVEIYHTALHKVYQVANLTFGRAMHQVVVLGQGDAYDTDDVPFSGGALLIIGGVTTLADYQATATTEILDTNIVCPEAATLRDLETADVISGQ